MPAVCSLEENSGNSFFTLKVLDHDAEALHWPTLACANIGTEKAGWRWSRADRLRAHGMHDDDFLSFICASVSDG
jgi:hypothetical protein